MSLCALRQAIGLGPTVSRLTTVQDVPSAPPTTKSPATTATPTTPAPPPSPPTVVQEVSPTIVEVDVLAT